MPFTAALSTAPRTKQALDEVCTQAASSISGAPDLAMVFFSPDHWDEGDIIVATVKERLAPRCLLGCVGESIVGNEREVEGAPALSLWLGRWSRPVELEAFRLTFERMSHTKGKSTNVWWGAVRAELIE